MLYKTQPSSVDLPWICHFRAQGLLLGDGIEISGQQAFHCTHAHSSSLFVCTTILVFFEPRYPGETEYFRAVPSCRRSLRTP